MDLLLELFSEEIPARMQARAADDLKRLVTDRMVEAGLTYSGGRAFSTPRRLALALSDLPKVTPGTVEERRGPRTDAPEKALDGFLRSTGLTRDDLEVRDDKKGQVYFATIRRPGRPAAEVVAEAVTHAVRNFPWPKSMRWGAGSLRWVRPLHSILCILTDEAGAEIVPFDIDGIRAGDSTRGHRFLSPGEIRVTGFEDYAHKLEQAHVVLDAEERARRIETDAQHLAFARGLEIVPDPGLLAEVAGLVEWPVALMGRIGEDFLDLPPEVLQTSMREHQKFFSVRDKAGGDGAGRITHFVTIANITAPDGGKAILAGNGRVLAARLSDAKFFWENDLRTVREIGMEGMAKPLESVTFHAKLGTQAERVRRIEALAREIAPKVGAQPDLAAEAARICQGRPRLRDGLRVPRAAGHDGPLLCRSRRPRQRRARSLRGTLPPPRPLRRRADRPRQHRRGAGRQAGHADRLLGHRREADRQQGPVCAEAGGAGGDPDRARERSASPIARALRRGRSTLLGRQRQQ